MRFALIVVSYIVQVIFNLLFLLIFPLIRLIFSLFGKRFLEMKWDLSKKSYWNVRSTKVITKENYKQ
ncbi:MAG: hypothetical protein CMG74_04150 [Candidatus Marinimicrobia bacterium]|nr:hypothetical protein [Candidatus Neomarinimicrobiota bacterium]